MIAGAAYHVDAHQTAGWSTVARVPGRQEALDVFARVRSLPDVDRVILWHYGAASGIPELVLQWGLDREAVLPRRSEYVDVPATVPPIPVGPVRRAARAVLGALRRVLGAGLGLRGGKAGW